MVGVFCELPWPWRVHRKRYWTISWNELLEFLRRMDRVSARVHFRCTLRAVFSSGYLARRIRLLAAKDDPVGAHIVLRDRHHQSVFCAFAGLSGSYRSSIPQLDASSCGGDHDAGHLLPERMEEAVS